MKTREQPVCSVCGVDIIPQPELGDRQGGPREIRHMATTHVITLCVEHAAPLFEFERYADDVLMTGTVRGVESVRYLPREEAPSEDGASTRA